MIQSLLTGISKVINTYLHLDPESPARLTQLQDKTIAIELLPLAITFYCQFNAQGVVVTTTTPNTIDAKITGTPWQMVNVVVNKQERQRFFAADLKINGDASVANQVMQLFDDTQVDLEQELAKFLGDTTAVHVTNFIKKTSNWLRTTVDSFADDINEYAHEEAKWFPPRAALQDFFQEIDELRMATDRIQQRFTQLAQALQNKKPPIDDEGVQ